MVLYYREIAVIEINTGNKLFSRSTRAVDFNEFPICHSQGNLRSAFGFKNGTICTGRLGLITSCSSAQIPQGAKSLAVGDLLL